MSPLTYLDLKSSYTIRLGKPFRQIRIPSKTPLQVNWCMTKTESITPACLWVFGTTHLKKEISNNKICLMISYGAYSK